MDNTEKLQEEAKRFSAGWGENNDEKSFIAGAEWQAQQSIKEEGWVSVEYRLPEIDDSVLVAFDNGDVDHDWYDKEFSHWSRLIFGIRKITHWQPLPEPPKK